MCGRIFGEPMRAIPAFREPGPRLELMDEQGLDRTLMFPTLASLVEERLRDDPEATPAVVHALNEWLYETWQFSYADRIFRSEQRRVGKEWVSKCRSRWGPATKK